MSDLGVRDEALEPEEGEAAASPSGGSGRGMRIVKRVALTIAALLAVLAVLAVVLYNFGSMERPSPEMRARISELKAAGQAPVVPARLHVPVPGCRCHSDDPAVQLQHESIPIKECSACHSRG